MSVRVSGHLDDETECVAFLSKTGVRIERDIAVRVEEAFGRDGGSLPNPFIVYLSNGSVLTLWGAYVAQSSSNFIRSHQTIRGRIGFVGPEPVGLDRLVDQLRVVPSNQKVAIYYRGHRSMRQALTSEASLESILDHRYGGGRYSLDVIDTEQLVAADIAAGDVSVRVGISLTLIGTPQGECYREQRYGLLSYSAPCAFQTAWRDMYSLCGFFSLLVGEPVTPATVQIISGGAGEHGIRPTFDIYFRRPRKGCKVPPRQAFRVLSSPERQGKSYSTTLQRWMLRREEWRHSNLLMAESMRRQREVSRDRFLTATAWFESIPEFYAQPSNRLSAAALTAAAEAAHRALQSQGDAPPLDRVRQVLGSLNATSLSRRIGDALAYLRLRYPPQFLPEIYGDLARAISRIRGRFAHGEDAFLGTDGAHVFAATQLMELICYLLTASDLQLENVGPSSGHPLNVALMELPERAVAAVAGTT